MTDELDDMQKIMQSVCAKIGTTDKDISDICKDAGITYYQIYKCSEHDSDVQYMLEEALVNRALLFFELSKRLVDNIEEFWTSTYVDRAGEHDVIKERMNAVATVKVKIEFYMNTCNMFAPMIFGDKSKDLRDVQKGMEELRELMERKKDGLAKMDQEGEL